MGTTTPQISTLLHSKSMVVICGATVRVISVHGNNNFANFNSATLLVCGGDMRGHKAFNLCEWKEQVPTASDAQ
jgi:hypothetical protein